MAKLSLGNITSGHGSAARLNANFDDIEAEFQDKVLYRNNPSGEANAMHNDIDMNGYRILNVGNLSTMGTVTPFVSLANFDAPNDGSTDASAEFLDALEYLRDQGGGALYIPEGEYLLSSQVILDLSDTASNIPIVLFGDSNQTARVLVGNSTGGIKINSYGKKNPCHLYSFAIEPYQDAAGTGFEYYRPARGAGEARYMFVAEDMSFTPKDFISSSYAFSVGLKVTGVYRPQIRECNISAGQLTPTKADKLLDISECWDPLVQGTRINASPKDSTKRRIALAQRNNGSTLVTITTTVTHSYTLSTSINVRVRTDNLFDGRFVISSIPTPLSFTYNTSATLSGSASISGANVGFTSRGEEFWTGGAEYGIYYECSSSKPEGGRIRQCNIVGPDTGLYINKVGTRQPQMVIEDNHINSQFIGMNLQGVKFGIVHNNLMYCTLLNEEDETDDEVSAGEALPTDTGVYTDILIKNADGIEILNNGFRGSANSIRRHVELTVTSSITGAAIMNVNIRNSRLHANTSVAPYSVGRLVRNVVIQTPTFVPTQDTASYPSNLVSVDDSASNVIAVSDTSEYGFNVKAFGAKGNGSAADVTAINTAIIAAGTLGGSVFFPPGTYMVSGYNGAVGAITLVSNVSLEGAGRGASILKKELSATAHVVLIDSGISNVTISSLTIHGNKTTGGSGHGLRLGGAENVTIDDVEIKYANGYGIGIQAGTNKNVNISNVHIHHTDKDGVDIKNIEDANDSIKFNNVLVEYWNEETSDTAKAAIDIRGPATLNNIFIRNPAATYATGVRFRNGELGSDNGLGGHGGSLANFNIDLTSATAGIAVAINARNVAVSNGYTTGGTKGIKVIQGNAKISGVTVENARTAGFSLDSELDESATGTADNSTFINCFARSGSGKGFETGIARNIRFIGCEANNNAEHGFYITSNNAQMIGCVSIDNSVGFRTTTSASGTQIIGGFVSGNGGGNVVNNGAGTRISNLGGYVTENWVQTGNLALDSTGERTTTLAHALSTTPDITKCSVSLVKQTNVSDCVIAFCRIESVDATNIIVNAKVTTASGTGGSTFRINAHVVA